MRDVFSFHCSLSLFFFFLLRPSLSHLLSLPSSLPRSLHQPPPTNDSAVAAPTMAAAAGADEDDFDADEPTAAAPVAAQAAPAAPAPAFAFSFPSAATPAATAVAAPAPDEEDDYDADEPAGAAATRQQQQQAAAAAAAAPAPVFAFAPTKPGAATTTTANQPQPQPQQLQQQQQQQQRGTSPDPLLEPSMAPLRRVGAQSWAEQAARAAEAGVLLPFLSTSTAGQQAAAATAAPAPRTFSASAGALLRQSRLFEPLVAGEGARSMLPGGNSAATRRAGGAARARARAARLLKAAKEKEEEEAAAKAPPAAAAAAAVPASVPDASAVPAAPTETAVPAPAAPTTDASAAATAQASASAAAARAAVAAAAAAAAIENDEAAFLLARALPSVIEAEEAAAEAAERRKEADEAEEKLAAAGEAAAEAAAAAATAAADKRQKDDEAAELSSDFSDELPALVAGERADEPWPEEDGADAVMLRRAAAAARRQRQRQQGGESEEEEESDNDDDEDADAADVEELDEEEAQALAPAAPGLVAQLPRLPKACFSNANIDEWERDVDWQGAKDDSEEEEEEEEEEEGGGGMATAAATATTTPVPRPPLPPRSSSLLLLPPPSPLRNPREEAERDRAVAAALHPLTLRFDLRPPARKPPPGGAEPAANLALAGGSGVGGAGRVGKGGARAGNLASASAAAVSAPSTTAAVASSGPAPWQSRIDFDGAAAAGSSSSSSFARRARRAAAAAASRGAGEPLILDANDPGIVFESLAAGPAVASAATAAAAQAAAHAAAVAAAAAAGLPPPPTPPPPQASARLLPAVLEPLASHAAAKVIPPPLGAPTVAALLAQQRKQLADNDAAAAAAVPASTATGTPSLSAHRARAATMQAAVASLNRLNVSNDAAYAPRRSKAAGGPGGAGGGPGGAGFQKVRHANPALTLSTLPLKQPSRSDLCHRPRGTWAPPPKPPMAPGARALMMAAAAATAEKRQREAAAAAAGEGAGASAPPLGPVATVRLSSLVGGAPGGRDALFARFADISLNETTGEALWERALGFGGRGGGGKFEAAAAAPGARRPVLWLRTPAGGVRLDPSASLAAAVAAVAAASSDAAVAAVAAASSDAAANAANAASGGEAALPPPPTPEPLLLEVAVALPLVQPLPTAAASALPPPASGQPTRPPGAFTRRRELTARGPGHLLLVEHLEERPLCLSRPGMGARLATYYRKRTPTDASGAKLAKKGVARRWTVGAVEQLAPQAQGPFALGPVEPGESVLSVDTSLARAPAVAHDPRPTDFLLIRSSTGALSLREMTGTILVGQHEPQCRVPAPGQQLLTDVEEARLVAFAARELRRRIARAERATAAAVAAANAAAAAEQQQGGTANNASTRAAAAARVAAATAACEAMTSIRVSELRDAFPAIPPASIKARLREKLDCLPVRADDDDGAWALRPGGILPVEGELRRLAPPEQWCGVEACRSGYARVRESGLRSHDRLAALPPDHLRVAADCIPPALHPGIDAAAAVVEYVVTTTPWGLTDAFCGIMRDGERGSLALTGLAEPSGRGRGFSYARDMRRAVVELPPGTSRRDAGAISGTARDLRRLSMIQAKEILVSMGMEPASVDKLPRWQRIGHIRDLSAAAAVDGGELGEKFGSRYARVSRVGAHELNAQRAAIADAIWERQLRAMRSATQLPDDPPQRDPTPKSAAEIQAAATAAAAVARSRQGAGGGGGGGAGAGGAAGGPSGSNNNANTGEDAAAVAELIAEGFLDASSVGGAEVAAAAAAARAARSRLEAAQGDRRVVRTIRWTDLSSGEQRSTVLVISDKDKVAALNGMYAKEGAAGGGSGFGRRTVRGRPLRTLLRGAAGGGGEGEGGGGVGGGPSDPAAGIGGGSTLVSPVPGGGGEGGGVGGGGGGGGIRLRFSGLSVPKKMTLPAAGGGGAGSSSSAAAAARKKGKQKATAAGGVRGAATAKKTAAGGAGGAGGGASNKKKKKKKKKDDDDDDNDGAGNDGDFAEIDEGGIPWADEPVGAGGNGAGPSAAAAHAAAAPAIDDDAAIPWGDDDDGVAAGAAGPSTTTATTSKRPAPASNLSPRPGPAKKKTKLVINVPRPPPPAASAAASPQQQQQQQQAQPRPQIRVVLPPPPPPPPPLPSPPQAAMARRHLSSRVLVPALAAARKALPPATLAPFRKAVAKSLAPDYTEVLSAAGVSPMDFERLERAAKSARYSTVADFVVDVRRIARAAEAYNDPREDLGGIVAGKYGGPGIPAMAREVVAAVEAELEGRAELARRLEREVVEEDAEREAALEARERERQARRMRAAEEGGGGGGGGGGIGGEDGGGNGAASNNEELWVQCVLCNQWRNVSPAVHAATVASRPDDAPWECSMDSERPGAGCHHPCDFELSKRLGLIAADQQ